MGLYGNIVLYPADVATLVPCDAVREILRVFAEHQLVLPEAASIDLTADDSSATFEEYVEESSLSDAHYAYACVRPEQLTKAMGQLVYVLDVDVQGQPIPIELPFLEISAFSTPAPLRDLVLDEIVGDVCAAIEFSYEDARLSEDIHRLRDPEHPILGALARVLGSRMECVVIAG
ncbi:MAG: hypothetical protein MJE66_24080 [Proteobacteria bacterium]|nr:hypothetical protein [Pseudomonadota bacterium]